MKSNMFVLLFICEFAQINLILLTVWKLSYQFNGSTYRCMIENYRWTLRYHNSRQISRNRWWIPFFSWMPKQIVIWHLWQLRFYCSQSDENRTMWNMTEFTPAFCGVRVTHLFSFLYCALCFVCPRPVSWVLIVASFARLSILDCAFGFL